MEPLVAPASAPPETPALHQLFERQQARSEVLRREDAGPRAIRLRKLQGWLAANRTAIQEALYAD
ncbi:MAG: hypothetical protein H7Z21_07835, partial [Hymenobacter sp.]|nr:hypothetical protein [Hymenobacter sp.]